MTYILGLDHEQSVRDAERYASVRDDVYPQIVQAVRLLQEAQFCFHGINMECDSIQAAIDALRKEFGEGGHSEEPY